MKVFDSDILRQIAELERKQLRALAELAIDPNNAEARQHLQSRQAQIEALRAQLSSARG